MGRVKDVLSFAVSSVKKLCHLLYVYLGVTHPVLFQHFFLFYSFYLYFLFLECMLGYCERKSGELDYLMIISMSDIEYFIMLS